MADYNTSKKTDFNTFRNISGTKNNHPKTVQETIKWLTEVLKRPPLPECPAECQRDCDVPEGKAPAYLNGNGKAHLVKWMPCQERMPRLDEIRSWFSKTKGIGTLGGWNGNHYIGFVDLDHKSEVFESYEAFLSVYQNWMDSYPILKTAPRFKTPSGGYRVILAFTEAQDWVAFTLAEGMPRMGELLQKNGSHTLLPPSLSIEGKPYQWEHFTEYPPVVTTPQEVGIYPTRKNHSNANNDRPLRKTFGYIPGALRLEDLGSDKSRAVLSGENITGDRSEALTVAAREWYGWENFCRKNGLTYNGTTEGLAAYAWSRLDDGKDPDKWERILKTVDPDSHTAAEYVGGDESCWKKIKRLAPDQCKEKSYQPVTTVMGEKTPVTSTKLNQRNGFHDDTSPVTLDPLSPDNEDFQELLEYGKQSLNLFEIYPQPLAELLTAKAKSLPVAPEAVHQTFMAIVAGIVGARSRVRVDKGWKEPLVFFTGFVAHAGSRKSPAMDVSRDPLVELQALAHATYEAKLEDYEAEKRRYDAMKKEDKGDREPPVAPHMRHYYLEDTTLEAVVSIHSQEANRNGFTLIYDELAEMFDGMDQYRNGKGSDRKKVLRLFGGKDLKTDRKTEGSSSFIPKSSVSVTGGIQESTLTRLISSSKDDDGLWDRFLWCFPRFVSVRERGTPTDITDYLKGLFREFDSLPEQDYTLSASSRSILYDFECWVEDQRHDVSQAIFQSYMKLIGYVPRLSLFLHLVDSIVTRKPLDLTISHTVVLRAIKLINFYAGQIHLLHSKAVKDSFESQLLQVIHLSQEKGQISTRDIQRKRITKTAEEAAELLKSLISKGIGRTSEGSRKQTLWEYQNSSGVPHRRFFIPSDVTGTKNVSNPDTATNTSVLSSVTEGTSNEQPAYTSANNVGSIAVPSGERREGSRIGNASLSQNGHTCLPEESGTGSSDDGEVLERSECTDSEGSRNGYRGGAGQNTSGENSIKKVQTGDLSRSKENAERSPEAKEAIGSHSPIQSTQPVLAVGQQAIDQRNGKTVTITKIDGEWIDFDGDHLSGTTHCSNLTPLPDPGTQN